MFPTTGLVNSDPTLDEILTRYKEALASLPPLTGLIEVTLQEKSYKRFWAKWTSDYNGVKIDGFDLFGGPLFNFEMARHLSPEGQRQETEIIFAERSSPSHFRGSREEFIKKIQAEADNKMRFEWLTLIDYLTRFGLPPPTLSHRLAIEKQEKQRVLYFFSFDANQQAQLDQKIFIERVGLRVTAVLQFDPGGVVRARMAFSDYRPVNSSRTLSVPGQKDSMMFPFLATIEEGGLKAKIVFKELKALSE